MEKKRLGIPLEILISSEKNMYELTNAAIHRAKQINVTESDDVEESGDKVVSLAIREIVTEEVQYNIKQD